MATILSLLRRSNNSEPPHIIHQLHARSAATKTHHLIFLIPGNPGCISYYQSYLAHLSNLLVPNASQSTSLTIVGTSLANFGSTPDAAHPYSLRGQIEFIERAVWKWARWVGTGGSEDGVSYKDSHGEKRKVKVKVTLIGHSVGAYIGMEVLRLWKDGHVPHLADESEALGGVEMDIVGFIGLWPTITHIAESPSGRRLRWMLRRAHFALFVSCLAYTLTFLLPGPILLWIVGRVTKFPSPAVASTASFISRPYSIRQALHMARFEMDEITEDRWADDIWHAGKDGPQLTFLFGDEDHWVAADAREELIRRRRATEGRPGASMEIDEMQIPHSFCIRDSKFVADRTSKTVRQVIKPS